MPGGEVQATSLSDALKKYEDAVKALVDAWPGEKDDEPKETDTTPPTDQAEKVLVWARKKYDGLVRWVLACFTAIGLLIFGSVPFVDLTAVDMKPVIIGLGLAGIGLGIVIWATTRALEPEDASLGEMKETLNLPAQGGLCRRLEWILRPKRAQARRLAGVLSSDPTAHFGPGIGGGSASASTTRLLDEIAAAETALLTMESGWRLAPDPPDLTNKSEGELEEALRTGIRGVMSTLAPNGVSGSDELWRLSDSDSRLAIIKQLSGEKRVSAVASWHSVVVALVTALAEPDPTKSTSTQGALTKAAGHLRDAKESLAANDHHPSAEQIASATKAVDDATGALNDAEIHERAAARRITDQRAILNNRLTHRDMLIAESGVSQLRGTFRIVRRWLFLGAVLTLTGGTLYAWAIANPTPYGLGMPITVTMPDSSKTAEELGFCGSKDDWEQTFAAVLMSKETASPQGGEFTAIATSGPCAGKIFTVSADDRSTANFVFGMPQAGSSSDEGTTEDDSTPMPEARVTVTIAPEAAAWDTVAKTCNLSTPKNSPITLPGYVSLPEGPLTKLAPFDAKVMCTEGTQTGLLVPITLKAGEGSYTAP